MFAEYFNFDCNSSLQVRPFPFSVLPYTSAAQPTAHFMWPAEPKLLQVLGVVINRFSILLIIAVLRFQR